ncbi:MAG: hypothetical protein R3F39_09630 [Myxococcota bacterium]
MLTATLHACSATSPATDATTKADADAGVVVLNDLGQTELQPDTAPTPDVEAPCENRCAKQFPVVPQCMATSWDIKTCTCTLRPAADGTACDDGVECTAADTCVAGKCEGGPPAELVEPSEGWQPEGTPLLQPDDPAWIWAAVHRDPSCRACDGSRAYLNWYVGGLHTQNPIWGAITAQGELATLELVAHIRTYDFNLTPAWDSLGSAFDGVVTTRRLRIASDGSFYAGGWTNEAGNPNPAVSWVARYGPTGDIVWERSLRQRFLTNDVLPTPDLGLYTVEAGNKSAAPSAALDFTLTVRRLDAEGAELWSTDIDAVQPVLRSPFRLARAVRGGAVLAYMAAETQTSPDGAKSERAWAASAARFDEQGGVAWQLRLSAPDVTVEAGPIVALSDDKFLVVGVQWPTFGPWDRYPVAVWWVDGQGNSLGETDVYPGYGDYFLATGATAAADGGVLIGGYFTRYRGSYAKPLIAVELDLWDSDGFVMKLDRSGNFEWMRLYGGPGTDFFWDVVASPDGRITAMGGLDEETGTKVRNWIVRTDFWGRTCGMRLGVCADMPWQDCEDGNPCTINWCDPDAGCTHPALPDGSPCGEGLTCQAAVCK